MIIIDVIVMIGFKWVFKEYFIIKNKIEKN